jgi:hypothetical protein
MRWLANQLLTRSRSNTFETFRAILANRFLNGPRAIPTAGLF